MTVELLEFEALVRAAGSLSMSSLAFPLDARPSLLLCMNTDAGEVQAGVTAIWKEEKIEVSLTFPLGVALDNQGQTSSTRREAWAMVEDIKFVISKWQLTDVSMLCFL